MFNIDKKYNSDILLYCQLNNIQNINTFVSECFKQGFDVKKYGLLGKTLNEGEKDLKTSGEREKWVEKEVIVEKRVEIPVEVIKEIEKIVEVPVDRIIEVEKIVEVPIEVIVEKEVIKEIPVEKVVTKIEYISDKTTEDELGGIIAELKNEMSKKDEELDELRRNLDIILDKPPVEIIKEVEVIKEIEKPNDKVNLLQQTIQNLTSEVRELKKKNEELEKKLLDQPRQTDGNIPARFHGSSNLNDGLYK